MIARAAQALVVLVLAATPTLATQREEMLVSAEWLAERAADHRLVILHVDRGRAAYDSAHVPGARFVEYTAFTETRNGLSTELPPVDHLVRLVEELGVSNDTRVIVYGNTLQAARFWFTMDFLGHGEQTSLLDGGLDAWRGAGHPVSTEPGTPPRRGVFHARPNPAVVVDADWVAARLNSPSVVLLDARSAEEYRGEREEELPRRGHIAGARNLDWTTLFEGGRLKPVNQLHEQFLSRGASDGVELVTYCRVGTRAAMLYFISRYLGYATRLYDGSMVEWSARADLPMARGGN